LKSIRLGYSDLELDADELGRKFIDLSRCDRVIRDEDATVLKPNGQPLVVYAKGALPVDLCRETLAVIRHLEPSSDNRGMASGMPRHRPIRSDGTLSRTTRAEPVPSSVMGFLDAEPRTPWCRMTRFTLDHPDEYEALQPLLRAIDAQYRELTPEHWRRQRAFANHVPDFVVPGTTFSSITVNRDYCTAAHTDGGNYRPGLAATAVLSGGTFDGGELIFPRYRTAVDLRMGGLCVADMHELHGNAPLHVARGGVRFSLVCYMRAGMGTCGTQADEWRRAAERAWRVTC
jgi:hypothetical protein